MCNEIRNEKIVREDVVNIIREICDELNISYSLSKNVDKAGNDVLVCLIDKTVYLLFVHIKYPSEQFILSSSFLGLREFGVGLDELSKSLRSLKPKLRESLEEKAASSVCVSFNTIVDVLLELMRKCIDNKIQKKLHTETTGNGLELHFNLSSEKGTVVDINAFDNTKEFYINAPMYDIVTSSVGFEDLYEYIDLIKNKLGYK